MHVFLQLTNYSRYGPKLLHKICQKSINVLQFYLAQDLESASLQFLLSNNFDIEHQKKSMFFLQPTNFPRYGPKLLDKTCLEKTKV
mgnify:CR=1 FL=1